MEITTYSNFRRKLKSYMDLVLSNHTPLFITRSNGEDMVLLSKEDYQSLQETLHLLSSTRNAQRLEEGIEQYKSGRSKKISLENLNNL